MINDQIYFQGIRGGAAAEITQLRTSHLANFWSNYVTWQVVRKSIFIFSDLLVVAKQGLFCSPKMQML